MKNSIFKICFFSISFLSIILIFSMRDLYSQETKIRIIRKDATLRLNPDTESLIIKKLPLGAELNFEETIGEWFKVKLPPDEYGIMITGYIHSSFVELKIKPTQTKKEIKPITIEPPKKAELSEIGNQEDYNQWLKQYENAKARLRTGNTLSILGGLFATAGTLLYFLDKEEETIYDYHWFYGRTSETEVKNKPAYLIAAAGGFAMALAGFLMAEPARNDVRMLEIEGARKRYLIASIGIINGGFAFKLKFSF